VALIALEVATALTTRLLLVGLRLTALPPLVPGYLVVEVLGEINAGIFLDGLACAPDMRSLGRSGHEPRCQHKQSGANQQPDSAETQASTPR
jgi:hypothetical protein